MHTLYRKEKVDPLIKYSQKVRHLDISNDSPNCKYSYYITTR
jgi:hypothetical protein